MEKFVAKPLEVTAIQWTGNNLEEVLKFTGKADNWDEYFESFEQYAEYVACDHFRFKIFTPCHTLIATPDDWIVRNHEGVIEVWNKERFATCYKEAGEFAQVLVPENLIGAACHALRKYGQAPLTLKGLRALIRGE